MPAIEAAFAAPDPDTPLALLGGLSPATFMKRHWQKKPLLIRQAIPGFVPPLDRRALFRLAADEAVESRLVAQGARGWQLRHGPFATLPPLKRAQWTLLVQGLDLHDDATHALLQRFRFVPDARLDDLMVSWASDGGGVGPHFDSYDVFLLQATGRRRWRIGRQRDLSLRDDAPLKILSHFEPEQEWVLEPGDMLYLPPRWAHDGVAEGGDCMTCSIGFRSPQAGGLAGELVQRLADEYEDTTLYRDPAQAATAHPAAVPEALGGFAADALRRLLDDRHLLDCVLGEVLTEPKPRVWFDEPAQAWSDGALRLDRRTRMLYDGRHVFINGESLRAAGADARLMRRLADDRALDAASVRRASAGARSVLAQWHAAGWLHRVGVMPAATDAWPQGRFEGRLAWSELLHQALDRALQDRVRQMVWCDPDFADWPLGERGLNERLHAWAHAGGHLHLLALDYRLLIQRHARFVQWRTTWSHRVEARAAPRELQEGFPTLMAHTGWGAHRTASPVPVVLASSEPARVQGLMLQWQSLWDRSGAAFPATTLGL